MVRPKSYQIGPPTSPSRPNFDREHGAHFIKSIGLEHVLRIEVVEVHALRGLPIPGFVADVLPFVVEGIIDYGRSVFALRSPSL